MRSPITHLPEFLKNEILFRLPFNDIEEGTIFNIITLWPSTIYIARIKDDENCGWPKDALEDSGWELLANHGDYVEIFGKDLLMWRRFELWRKMVGENEGTTLPEIKEASERPTELKSAVAIFVVEGIEPHFKYINKSKSEENIQYLQ